MLHVNKWGNNGEGPSVFGERPLVDGPWGYLDKFRDRRAELESIDYVCEGDDTQRCPWPMGIYSQNKAMCSSGFAYSYVA